MLTASGDSGHNKAIIIQHNLVNKVCAISKNSISYTYYTAYGYIMTGVHPSCGFMPLHCNTYITTGQTVSYSHRNLTTAAKAHPDFT